MVEGSSPSESIKHMLYQFHAASSLRPGDYVYIDGPHDTYGRIIKAQKVLERLPDKAMCEINCRGRAPSVSAAFEQGLTLFLLRGTRQEPMETIHPSFGFTL